MNTFMKFALAASFLSLTACGSSSKSNTNEELNSVAQTNPDTLGEITEVSEDEEPEVDKSILLKDGEAWTVAFVDGQGFSFDDPFTIQFHENGSISGVSACNNYMGRYEAKDDGTLSIEVTGVTMKMCAEENMSFETVFLTILPQVTSYQWAHFSESLTLWASGVGDIVVY